MRLELDRRLAPAEGEALAAAVREALGELQGAVGDFAAMLADGRADGRRGAGRRGACAATTRSRRRSRSSNGCATATSSCSERAPTTMAEGPAGATVQVRAGSGLGILRDDGQLALRRADGAGRTAGVPARAPRPRRRPARDRQDEPPLARASPRTHGRRLRARAAPRRHALGAAARDRPVHLARLPGAGLAYAAPAPQAAGDHRGRGPDRGLARLQGDGRGVRVVPARRAVPGAASRRCAPSWWRRRAPRRRSASR